MTIDTNKQTFICECGCNLQFIEYSIGLDICVGNKWIITEFKIYNNGLNDYRWSDYLQINQFKFWSELREYIIINYNSIIANPIQLDMQWIHLYNFYIKDDNFDVNDKLYYEYIF